MIFAIGTPGEAVRQYVHTESQERAAIQCDLGEVALQVDEVLQRGAIAPDGSAVITGETPQSWHLDDIRIRRTALLARCDWTVLPGSPLQPEQLQAWHAYRQALRDITELQAEATLETVVWPAEPAGA